MSISKKFRAGLAAVVLLAMSGVASATVHVLGNASPGNGSPGPTVAYLDIISFSNASTPTPSGTSINSGAGDEWYFTQLQPFYLKNAAVSFNFYSSFQVQLFGPTGGVYGPTGLVWDSGLVTVGNQIVIPYTLLQEVGTYFIRVLGTSSNAAANYSGVGNIVPLPAAAWLLLSGVVGLGAMARRRKVAVEA